MASYDSMILAEPELAGYWNNLSGASAVDASSGGHDGTYVNTPTLGVASGIVGGGNTACSFTAAQSEYINVPGAAASGSAATLEVWVIASASASDTSPMGWGTTVTASTAGAAGGAGGAQGGGGGGGGVGQNPGLGGAGGIGGRGGCTVTSW